MNIDLTYIGLKHGRAAILRPDGALDWSSYQNLIAQAWAAYESNTQHLIIDLRDVEHISTAGMVGLYAVARLAQGSPPLDIEAGWQTVRALAEDLPIERHLAVMNPCPQVRLVLEDKPFSDFLTLYADLDTVLAVLSCPTPTIATCQCTPGQHTQTWPELALHCNPTRR
jgi:ABC-type transporter Mla MlaB component